jgi:hypothetical protein
MTIYDPAHPVAVRNALTLQTPTYTTMNPELGLRIANHDALLLFPAKGQPQSQIQTSVSTSAQTTDGQIQSA